MTDPINIPDNIHLGIQTGIVYLEDTDTGKRLVVNAGFSEEDGMDFRLNELVDRINE